MDRWAETHLEKDRSTFKNRDIWTERQMHT